MNRTAVFLTLLLVLIFPAQVAASTSQEFTEINTYAPWPTYQWSQAIPEQLGMDSAHLESMMDHFSTNNIQIDDLLVIRKGWLVFEGSSTDYNSNETHHLFSCTKSITSTLIGIALNLGLLDSIENPILEIFSDYDYSNPSELKEKITIKDLLEMAAGLDWNEEQYGDVINDYNKMIRSTDWVQYVLDKPMTTEPGTKFLYNSGASHLLSAIIQKTSGNSTLDFATKYLFNKLGITDFEWDHDPNSIVSGASGLKLRPADMAKIGYLYLRNGMWNASQIIPEDWVNATSESQINVDVSLDYSYQWWILSNLGAYYALGWGYQSIIVVPQYELVIVVTAATLDSSAQVESILRRWIFPSLGLNYSLSGSFTISPFFVLIGTGPFIVMLIAYVMDVKKLWIENESKEAT